MRFRWWLDPKGYFGDTDGTSKPFWMRQYNMTTSIHGIQGEEGWNECCQLVCSCGIWSPYWFHGIILLGSVLEEGVDLLVVRDMGWVKKRSNPFSSKSTVGRNRHQHSGRSSWVSASVYMGKPHRLIARIMNVKLEGSEGINRERLESIRGFLV